MKLATVEESKDIDRLRLSSLFICLYTNKTYLVLVVAKLAFLL